MPVRGKQEVVFESGLIRALAGKTGKELPSHFSIGIDREQIPEATLYGGRRIWRYSNEQVWKWIPVCGSNRFILQREKSFLLSMRACNCPF